MDENFKDDDHLSDHWLSNWEQKTVDGWDSDSSLEERIQTEKDRCKQKLWTSFQTSASSISHLYKEGCEGNRVSLWVPFQNSASAVTIMYKDSLDVMKQCFELGTQYASKRQRKEMLSWAKKRKRHLRRDELIGYMCGKPPPPSRHSHNRSSSRTLGSRGLTMAALERGSPRLQSPRISAEQSVSHHSAEPADLQPFCDALALQGLNGAMSNFGLDSTSHQNANNSSTEGAAASSVGGGGAGGNSSETDFHYFLLNEISRRQDLKRSNSGNEHPHDSPTRKRSRLL